MQVILKRVEHIETGLAKLGQDYRMVISSGEKLISITKRQFSFLKHFLANGNVDDAAISANVERRTVLSWFKNPRFRQFLKERLQYAADRNGCTFDWAVSELKNTWEGKKKTTKTQIDAMKEINRMLGFVKETQGGINAREFINAEYVVIQKGGPANVGSEFTQIPGASRSIPGQVHLPDVRTTVGEVNTGGVEGSESDQSAAFDGLVSEQSAQAGEGYNLGEDASDIGSMQKRI